MFFVVMGNKFRATSEGPTEHVVQCPNCGMTGRLERKTGRQYLTLFFVLPVLPIGPKQSFAECPNCGAQFRTPEALRRAA
jgi:predicted RNA-binding Zn-ribbon protein involved in translation (DUF1610 family)